MQPSHTEDAAADAEELPAAADIPMAMDAAPHYADPPPMLAAGPQPPGQAAARLLPTDVTGRGDPALFDHWLRRELGRLHDGVLREPIPDRLRSIIDGGSKGCG